MCVGEQGTFTDETVIGRGKNDLPLKPIVVYIEEALEERKENITFAVFVGQVRLSLDGVITEDMEDVEIAYEPVIGIDAGEKMY